MSAIYDKIYPINQYIITYSGEIYQDDGNVPEECTRDLKLTDDIDMIYDPINYTRSEFNAYATRLSSVQVFGNVYVRCRHSEAFLRNLCVE